MATKATTATASPVTCPVESPIRLLDVMVVLKEHEKVGTPRPAITGMLFVTGLQAIERGVWEKAKENMSKCMAEAEKSDSKIELATAYLGLGYLQARLPEPNYKVCLQMYLESLKVWEQLHGTEAPQLAFLLSDIAAVAATEHLKSALPYLRRAISLLANTPIPSVQPGSDPNKKDTPFTLGTVMMQRAQVYMSMKRPEKAAKIMHKAVKKMKSYNDPNLKKAQEVLAQIQTQAPAHAAHAAAHPPSSSSSSSSTQPPK